MSTCTSIKKGQIIFTAVLLFFFMAGCNDKDKPKEMPREKKLSVDTICPTAIVGDIDKKSKVDNTKIQVKQDVKETQKTQNNTKEQVIKEQTPLPKVILITTSEGCKCALAKCSEGEKTINGVVGQFSEKLSFEKVDYAKERDSVDKLTREYKFYSLPTLLFLDSAGKFTKKIESTWDEKMIKETLTGLGVK